MEPEAAGDVPDDELEGGQIVGGGERVGVLEIDLVLPGGHLVVRRLHLEPHFQQLLDDDPPDLLAPVDRPQVEVGGRIVRDRSRRPSADFSNRKNSASHPAIMVKPSFRARVHLALERGARAAGEGLLVRRVDVAEQPGDPAPLVVVGKDPEGVRSGLSSMSDSSIRTNPSIEEPSNMISPSRAFSNWLRGISTFLFTPRMSVNCSRRKSTPKRWASLRTSSFPAPLRSSGKAFEGRTGWRGRVGAGRVQAGGEEAPLPLLPH